MQGFPECPSAIGHHIEPGRTSGIEPLVHLVSAVLPFAESATNDRNSSRLMPRMFTCSPVIVEPSCRVVTADAGKNCYFTSESA